VQTAPRLFAAQAAQGAELPPELTQVCEACLQTEPARRPAHAGVVADTVRAWLAGAHRAEAARAHVAAAEDLRARAVELRTREATLRGEAARALAGVAPAAPSDGGGSSRRGQRVSTFGVCGQLPDAELA
jgi:hypothetical protein